MLSTVLGICGVLGSLGLLLDRQLVSTIEKTGRITVRLEHYATQRTQLRALRGRMADLAAHPSGRHDGGKIDWRAMAKAIAAQQEHRRTDDPALPAHDDAAGARLRLAEHRFVEAGLATMRVARRDPRTVPDMMPRLGRAMDSLDYWRNAVRLGLRREQSDLIGQAETTAKRALLQMTLAVALMLALVSGLILWLRWRIMGPLMTIVTAVRAMNAGGTLPRLRYAGRVDELGELTRGLQLLSEKAEERERIQRQVEYLAHHDPLTGLANRVVFAEQLTRAVQAGERIALLAIDLDGFKGVNDTLGHAMGDAMLQRASALLAAAVARGDVVARIGGDEFAVIHYLPATEHDATALAARIFALAAADPASPAIRLSIGIALSQRHGVEGDELHACADIALYRAKADGRHRARHYDAAMDEERRQRHWLAHELRDASVRGELSLAFQPIADCASRRIIGQEALARWTHPVLGPITPIPSSRLPRKTG